MRLIDADKLMNRIELRIKDYCRDCNTGAQKIANLYQHQIKKLVEKQPTVLQWISVSERLPEKTEYLETSDRCEYYMRRFEVAYMTDTIEYTFGYYDGEKWMDKRHGKIENVVAWKLHEPYRKEPEKEDNQIECH
ncbi:DUF551 domain-containing protein [Bariatricus massiliensis]|uniref:DUF551 domain-containing protein n=1 Tax=Bariatricus massiliensis TaxID=1745713 RepID=UPI00082F2502|nr:DUF551 domain-containing protein [Bariatricus massiliensis]